jgi:hypothetical protein
LQWNKPNAALLSLGLANGFAASLISARPFGVIPID